ncbi:MAG: DUF2089 domain-containing protein [Anaerolineae bacterium]|jgi:hypothetical protein|nr:DUF2089 domain-containing protein [Anaerolineae bacterium]MBT3714047.1 DUF2089 domain-containing protein [Anaerolineae bacterium]MBT4311220.1 DUF2089 domain-containing protein [Anaerolineae bacterium]MBT4459273.1 DUF2089 domain-containing protein [Anaerolineae bacterium]MBT4841301.1 DUF2089 domain-containing protein [Anaerolineae bacterium]
MNPTLTQCPVCKDELVVTRLHCSSCNTTIDGRFFSGPFSNLSHKQMEFVEVFVRCEGKITRVETELSLSYPTIRNRLHEVIRAMGYEPGKDELRDDLDDEKRRNILEDLNAGRISAEEAMSILGGEEE